MAPTASGKASGPLSGDHTQGDTWVETSPSSWTLQQEPGSPQESGQDSAEQLGPLPWGHLPRRGHQAPVHSGWMGLWAPVAWAPPGRLRLGCPGGSGLLCCSGQQSLLMALWVENTGDLAKKGEEQGPSRPSPRALQLRSAGAVCRCCGLAALLSGSHATVQGRLLSEQLSFKEI